MYERKIPEDLECGITVSMKVLGGKWKPCIIDAINRGFRRPSAMHRQIPATPRVIDMQLRELDSYGIVFKTVQPGYPLRVEYHLSELGQTLLPVIAALDQWGYANRHIAADVEIKGEVAKSAALCDFDSVKQRTVIPL